MLDIKSLNLFLSFFFFSWFVSIYKETSLFMSWLVRLASVIKTQRSSNYITMHFPQQPAFSPGSLTSILPSGAREPNAPDPDGYDDISLLYRRISRTRS